MKIAVVGMGNFALSDSTLLSQNHEVVLLNIDSKRVERLNKKVFPIHEEVMVDFLRDKLRNSRAILDKNDAYANAHYVINATPTVF